MDTPSRTPQEPAPLDLPAIAARWSAASPGPWVVGFDDVDRLTFVRTLPWDSDVATVHRDGDAVFIAHAREDVPALVGEVERLRGEVVEAQRELVRLRDFEAMVVEMSRGGSVRVVDLATARVEAARRRAPSPASDGGPR